MIVPVYPEAMIASNKAFFVELQTTFRCLKDTDSTISGYRPHCGQAHFSHEGNRPQCLVPKINIFFKTVGERPKFEAEMTE